MNLPHGTKADWWDFVYEADTFLSRIESRLMFVLDEMTRRHEPSKKKKSKKKAISSKENSIKEKSTSTPPSTPPLVKEITTMTPPPTPSVTPLRPLKKRRLIE
jgi:hypothetical protein